jgi:hypothetical protein
VASPSADLDGAAPAPPAGLVINQRRVALLAAAAALAAGAAEIGAAFGRVTAALHAGAWAGTAADAWSRELARTRSSVDHALGAAALGCANVARAQPDWVTPDDPRSAAPHAMPGFLLGEG